jgi:hypothetical protein
LDDLLLAGVQRASDHIHAVTGFDSLSQAEAAMIASLPCCGMRFLTDSPQRLLGVVFVVAWTAFALFVLLWSLPVHRDEIRTQAERGLRNHEGVSDGHRLSRLIWLAIVLLEVPFLATHYWGVAFDFCALIHYYLRACDPKPPAKGKIRQWLSRLALFLEPMPSEA